MYTFLSAQMYQCTRKQNKLLGERIQPNFILFTWVLVITEVPLIKKLHGSLMWGRNISACVLRQSNFTRNSNITCEMMQGRNFF